MSEKFPANESSSNRIPKISEADFSDILRQAEFYVDKNNNDNEGDLSKPEKIEDNFDFLVADNLSELYKLIKDKEPIIDSSGNQYSADEILALIQSGHLESITRKNNLREAARKCLLQQEFRFAHNLEEVYEELRRRKTISGTVGIYTAEEIINLIENRQLNKIPRTNGLRVTVRALLKL